MLIALFADIHANREALNACLADAARKGAEQYVFLGDLVGYGPDPAAVVERIAAFAAAGGLVIQGNHDAAVVGVPMALNEVARAAVEWTEGQLGVDHLRFLDRLPLEISADDRLYVHASACRPAEWNYILQTRDARESFEATGQRLTLCGHTHLPVVFSDEASGKPKRLVPIDNCPMPLPAQQRWITVLGAVGQPRDRNAEACYGLLDSERDELTYQRVPYDVQETARKILEAGLPEFLARRLLAGR